MENPPQKRESGKNDYLDLSLSEECSYGFFPQKEAGAACPAKSTNLICGPKAKFYNPIEIVSADYNTLIAAYQKLKSKPPGNMTPGESPRNIHRKVLTKIKKVST